MARTSSRRIGILMAVALVGCLVVAVAPGVAGKIRYSSTISLKTFHDGEDFVFKGRVRSEKPGCERNRRVQIWAGNHTHFEGEVRTDDLGRYELRVLAEQNTIGGYEAFALRKERKRFICKPARSGIENSGDPVARG